MVGLATALAMLAAVACRAATPTAVPTPIPTTRAPAASTATPTTAPAATATATPTRPAVTATVAASTATPTTALAATATPTSAPVATPTPTRAPLASPTPTGATPRRGGVLVQQSGEPTTFDSQRGGSSTQIWANVKIYNNLVRDTDPTDNTVLGCDLCESFAYTDNGLKLVFKLRPGVKFHNGKTLDAEDVKYSLHKMMGLVDGVIATRVGPIKEYLDPAEPVTVVDPLTVRLNLIRPADAPIGYLGAGTAGIMPKDYPADKAAKEPMGTGPFTVQEYIRGSHAVFKRNDSYFRPGQPYLDGVKGQIITGTSVIEAAFLTRKVDAYFSSGEFSSQNQPLLDRKIQAGEVVFVRIPYGGWYPIAFNTKHPVLSDVRVRRAIHLAFDRDGMALTVFDGKARLKTAFAEPYGRTEAEIRQLPGWRQPKDQDLAEAKRLMAAAGYANGVEITGHLTRNNSTNLQAFNEYLQAQMRLIGITTKLDLQETSVIYDRMAALNYGLVGDIFALDSGHPDEPVLGYFITGAARNWYGYSNPKVDDLGTKASAELDPVKKKQLLLQIEDIILEDLPLTFTVENFQGFQWYSDVKGIVIGARHATMLNFDAVWLDKR